MLPLLVNNPCVNLGEDSNVVNQQEDYLTFLFKLQKEIQDNNISEIERLINNDPNKIRHCLLFATTQGYEQVVEYLIHKSEISLKELFEITIPEKVGIYIRDKIDPNLILKFPDLLTSTEIDDFSFLHLSVYFKEKRITQIILNAGADCNLASKKGKTLLHIACKVNDLEGLKELLKLNKINVNAKDNEGNTPLHLATHLGSEECVKTLLEAGSLKNVKNNANITPEQLAYALNHLKIISLFQIET